MPNLKASIKDLRKTKKRTTFNDRLRERVKKATKQFNKLVDSEQLDKAKTYLSQLNKVVDKATKNKVFKKENASRKVSRLTKKLNKKITATDVKAAKKSA